MKTPESSQAPDLMRMVSWMRVCCVKFLFAMVIAMTQVSSSYSKAFSREHTVLAEQGNERAVSTPNDVLDGRRSDLREGLLLLDVVENDRRCGAENQAGSTAVEDLVRLDGRFDALDDRVGQVADLDELPARHRPSV